MVAVPTRFPAPRTASSMSSSQTETLPAGELSTTLTFKVAVPDSAPVRGQRTRLAPPFGCGPGLEAGATDSSRMGVVVPFCSRWTVTV
jgi:hypothetical protein